MKTTIYVDNMKCGGCTNSIHKSLRSLNGIFGVNIDRLKDEITIDHTDELSREAIVEKLQSLGYPEKGSTHGFSAMKAGAKSYVSCAIGRFSEKK